MEIIRVPFNIALVKNNQIIRLIVGFSANDMIIGVEILLDTFLHGSFCVCQEGCAVRAQCCKACVIVKNVVYDDIIGAGYLIRIDCAKVIGADQVEIMFDHVHGCLEHKHVAVIKLSRHGIAACVFHAEVCGVSKTGSDRVKA